MHLLLTEFFNQKESEKSVENLLGANSAAKGLSVHQE